LQAIEAAQFPKLAARLELIDAQLAISLMQRKAGLAALDRAAALYAQLDGTDVPLALAEIQRLTGRAYTFLGRFSEAERLLNAALATFRNAGDRKLVGMTLEALAGLRFATGDVAGSRPLYAEALRIFEAMGAERSASVVATNLAEAEFRGGDATAALVNARAALAATRARNDIRSVAISLANIAAYLVALQRWDEAGEHAREALNKARRANDDIVALFALQHLAAAFALRADKTDGRKLRASAAQLLGYVDARSGALDAAREYTEQHEYDAALRALREVFETHELEHHFRVGSMWTEDVALAQAIGLP
jgi:tetratricopeptide (TPR) repeat protein